VPGVLRVLSVLKVFKVCLKIFDFAFISTEYTINFLKTHIKIKNCAGRFIFLNHSKIVIDRSMRK